MGTTMSEQDFYEDDEPVQKIRAAFVRGEKGTTQRPTEAPSALSASWDSSSLVIEQGSFGGHGSTVLEARRHVSANVVPA